MADRRFQDEHEIARLLVQWAHARDYDEWDRLAACFHEGATIHIGWISGSASEYIRRSKAQTKNKAAGTVAKHIVTAPLIEVAGSRAFSICHANLHVRRPVRGVEVDIESWMRFFDLMERREARWGIVKRTGVYEKDRIQAVDPKGFPDGFWDGIDLAQFPPAKRFLCFAQVKDGSAPNVDFVSASSPEEAGLHEEGKRWLSGA